jgi:hypothetical protein
MFTLFCYYWLSSVDVEVVDIVANNSDVDNRVGAGLGPWGCGCGVGRCV